MAVKALTILCIGDIFGEPGRRALVTFLPRLRSELQVDLVIANVENAAAGFGVTPGLARGFLEAGVDVMTSGNHIWDRKEIIGYIVKENLLLRPANYPAGTPGVGSVIVKAGAQQVGVLNLQGRTFMASIDCPFARADEELQQLRAETPLIVVDMHAEATSEKQAMGWYLDGRVSAVVGTHSHVQTADERILPQGTAYLTDLGLTGPFDSVIGVEPELAIQRFRTGMPNRFEPARGRARFQGAVIRVDPESGRALAIARVQRDLPGVEGLRRRQAARVPGRRHRGPRPSLPRRADRGRSARARPRSQRRPRGPRHPGPAALASRHRRGPRDRRRRPREGRRRLPSGESRAPARRIAMLMRNTLDAARRQPGVE